MTRFIICDRRQIMALCGGLSALLACPAAPKAALPQVQARFDLMSHRGAPMTDAAMRGSPSLVFFGFTGCPDICPTTLLEIANLYAAAGPTADRLKTFFITVDPENDTPERLALYLQSFDPHVVGLTGTRLQIDAAIRNFLAYAERLETPAGTTWSHSTGIYAFDDGARFLGFLNLADGSERALQELGPYLEPGR